jgi:peroxiredoxin
MDEQGYRLPLIGEKAPSFVAESTQGTVHFPEDFKGKWVVFFSHPGDDVIIPPPGSCGAAKDRVDKAGEDYRCLDWFLCLKKDPGK